VGVVDAVLARRLRLPVRVLVRVDVRVGVGGGGGSYRQLSPDITGAPR
jgi:hypothetical protein